MTLAWRCCLYPRTALHWALQLSLPAQRHLRDLQAVLHCVGNTFCSWCQAAPSTRQVHNGKILPHRWLWFFESLCLILWKRGFGMLRELLETWRQQDAMWATSFTSLSWLRDQAELQSPGWTQGKDCTSPTYLGKAWGYGRTEVPRSWLSSSTQMGKQMEKKGGASWCFRESWDQWPFVEHETGWISSSLPSLATLPYHSSPKLIIFHLKVKWCLSRWDALCGSYLPAFAPWRITLTLVSFIYQSG